MTDFIALKDNIINLAQIRYITWESNPKKIRKPTIFIWLINDNVIKLEYNNEEQYEHHVSKLKLNLTFKPNR